MEIYFFPILKEDKSLEGNLDLKKEPYYEVIDRDRDTNNTQRWV
jgi:hypothetical protein